MFIHKAEEEALGIGKMLLKVTEGITKSLIANDYA